MYNDVCSYQAMFNLFILYSICQENPGSGLGVCFVYLFTWDI